MARAGMMVHQGSSNRDDMQTPQRKVTNSARGGQGRRAPLASVVIPTRNRHDLLKQCLQALAGNLLVEDFEVIVVDDGSTPRVDPCIFPAALDGSILHLDGVGPAAARNAGIAESHAPVILFTDDDTIPRVEWVASALSYLDAHPECVGVDGPVCSPPWDPLFESSVEAHSAHRWTCNVAYRRAVLERVGMFQQHLFRFAHAEDRDLSVRMLTYGPIGYEQRMEIVHTPRAITFRDVFRQARWTHDDLVLFALHPQLTHGYRLPAPLALIRSSGIRWMRAAKDSNGCITPRRGVRALAFFLVGLLTAGFTVIQTSSAKELRRRYAEFLPESQPRL